MIKLIRYGCEYTEKAKKEFDNCEIYISEEFLKFGEEDRNEFSSKEWPISS